MGDRRELDGDIEVWISDLTRALEPVLEAALTGRSLPPAAQKSLQTRLTELTQTHPRVIAFCPNDPEAIAAQIPHWLNLLSAAAPTLQTHPQLKFLFEPPLRSQTLVTAWRLWIPWAVHLCNLKQQKQYGDRPLIQGVLGVQGTGKTTLGLVMEILLSHQNQTLCRLSIDDFYLTYAERQQLRQRDPRLIWRGPPGTHDVDLAIETLDRLCTASPGDDLAIPQFDKSLHGGQGDRCSPKPIALSADSSADSFASKVDVVWFEGWLVGCDPIEDAVFDGPLPDPIVSDSDRQFARDCNQRLANYGPLWDRLDRWAVLVPNNYQHSKHWRQQAERSRIAAGGQGLSDTEIDDFVTYFWRALHPSLFVTHHLTKESTSESQGDPKPLKRSPNCIIEIQGDRQIGTIHTPPEGSNPREPL